MSEEEMEREPHYDTPDEGLKRAGRLIVVVVAIGLVIGYAASQSYTQYPYTVNVSGTWTSSGSIAINLAVPACDAWTYQQCPDPGEQPVYQCFAEPVMNMTNRCVTYDLTTDPGHFSLSLRNGEDYNVTAYMVNSHNQFVKVCFAKLVLSPDIGAKNATQNFTC